VLIIAAGSNKLILKTHSLLENKNLGSLEVFSILFNESINKVIYLLSLANNEKNQPSLESITPFFELLLENVFENTKYGLAHIQAELKSSALSEAVIKSRTDLFNRVKISCKQWEINTCFVISNFLNDRTLISQKFFHNRKIGDIKLICDSKGDLHEKGLQTLVLELTTGERICFKPRSLKLENSFFNFLETIGISNIYIAKFVEKDTYGWMEYIQHKQCDDIDGIKNYYHRCGLLLSVLYALEAEDIHYENMIAQGSHPVIVDLETLFHHGDDTCLHSHNQTMSLGKHTVLKTHFLPQFINSDAKNEVSAIANNQLKSNRVTSVPFLNGEPVLIDNFIPNFIHGFTVGYEIILKKKKELLSKNSLLNIFVGSQFRYVPRSTNVYDKLIKASQIPDFANSIYGESELRKKLFFYEWARCL